MEFSLRPPYRDLLPSYIAALETGWSPSTIRDVSSEQLAAICADADAFLTDLNRPGAPLTLADGRRVSRLPGCLLWMWDGEFCGSQLPPPSRKRRRTPGSG
jgi:hypothetical protein